MARTFVAASSQTLSVAAAVVATYPLTMAAWVNLASLNAGRGIMAIHDGSTSNRFALQIGGTNFANAVTTQAATNRTAISSVAVSSTGVWFHVCGVFTNATLQAIYLNGDFKGTQTTSVTPGALTTTTVGQNGTGGAFMDGQIAWPAIWNSALSDGEVAKLATGIDPRNLSSQRAALVAFWPLTGASPEPSLVGSFNLTVTGATASADPATIITRTPRRPVGFHQWASWRSYYPVAA